MTCDQIYNRSHFYKVNPETAGQVHGNLPNNDTRFTLLANFYTSNGFPGKASAIIRLKDVLFTIFKMFLFLKKVVKIHFRIFTLTWFYVNFTIDRYAITNSLKIYICKEYLILYSSIII